MKSDTVTNYVIGMLVLQVITVAVLWILNVLSEGSTEAFAILLAANLVAFAMVVQAYRNPESVQGSSKSEQTPPAPAAAAPAAPQASTTPTTSPPRQALDGEKAHGEPVISGSVAAALPRIVHLGIPIGSIFIILAFALVLTFPPDKSTLPVESTTFFIPIYLTIVVVLVFGSMYLFKKIVDTADVPAIN
jgi:hypothetical protein